MAAALQQPSRGSPHVVKTPNGLAPRTLAAQALGWEEARPMRW